MTLIYLAAILFSTLGMLIIDWRGKLAFFHQPTRTALTLGIGTIVFLIWDFFGIGLGIFFDGGSPLTTGIMLAPELPLEEIFFLFFLCYFSLIIFRSIQKLQQRRTS